jgi:hypothetical protein
MTMTMRKMIRKMMRKMRRMRWRTGKKTRWSI